MTDRVVRRARHEDREAVASIAEVTWTDREVDDYLARVFPEWIETDGDDQYTAVVTVDGEVVGTAQATMLTEDEAWLQGLRVHPDYRGEGHSEALAKRLLEWSRDHGATIARNMVFGWNTAGMGQSRAVGLEPVTACRWAQPDPAREEGPPTMPSELTVRSDPNAAWRFWTDSDARSELSGLALATDESWAVSELTRDRFLDLAETGTVLAVVGETVRGVTVYRGTGDRDGTVVCEYAVAAWADTEAATELFGAIRADAAQRGADRTRVLVPQTPQYVSDVAVTRVPLSDRSVYVFRTSLVAE